MSKLTKNSVFVAALAVSSISVQAQISFSFDYSGSTHFQGSQVAKDALESAASIASSFFTHTASVTMEVTSTSDGSDTLASAGSNFAAGGTIGFGNRGIVGHKILTGVDLNDGAADGVVSVNFGQNWDFDDSIDANLQDFKSTMIHELLHAVGFSSTIAQNGNDPFGITPGNAGNWAPFDEFVFSSSGRIIGADGILNGTAWNTASVGGTGADPAVNGLYFGGPQAQAAFGGNPVPIYSPGTWSDGSSGSHLDDDFFTGVESKIMNAATGNGPGIRSLSSVEQAIFRDLGFTVVPEPYEYALITVLGLSLVVFDRRRRLSSELAEA